MGSTTLYYGATALTNNAGLTCLGSLVEGLSPAAKYSLAAGAVSAAFQLLPG
jgi:hypothetical protein